MITPTKQLAAEAVEELSDVLDFIASERGTNDPMYLALSEVEGKLEIIQRRLANPVVQQEPSKHIPKDPYKTTSDKCYVDGGKLRWL